MSFSLSDNKYLYAIYFENNKTLQVTNYFANILNDKFLNYRYIFYHKKNLHNQLINNSKDS